MNGHPRHHRTRRHTVSDDQDNRSDEVEDEDFEGHSFGGGSEPASHGGGTEVENHGGGNEPENHGGGV
jgi:hypothetical protein